MRGEIFYFASSGSRHSGTTPFPTSAISLPCKRKWIDSASKRKSLLNLDPNALSAGLEQATFGRESTAGAGDVHTIPTRSARPIQSALCFPAISRETHLRNLQTKKRNGTTLQLFVEPKESPPRFELLRFANGRASSLPCMASPGTWGSCGCLARDGTQRHGSVGLRSS
jgi:hypothetical protein